MSNSNPFLIAEFALEADLAGPKSLEQLGCFTAKLATSLAKQHGANRVHTWCQLASMQSLKVGFVSHCDLQSRIVSQAKLGHNALKEIQAFSKFLSH